jgi:hypothetical protein
MFGVLLLVLGWVWIIVAMSTSNWSRDGLGNTYSPMHRRPYTSSERATFGVYFVGLLFATVAIVAGALYCAGRAVVLGAGAVVAAMVAGVLNAIALGVYSGEFHRKLVGPKAFGFSFDFCVASCVFLLLGAIVILIGIAMEDAALKRPPAAAKASVTATPVEEEYRPHWLAFIALLFVLVAFILAIIAASVDNWSQEKLFLVPGSGFKNIDNWRTFNSGGRAAFAFVLLAIIFAVPTFVVGTFFAVGGSRASGFGATGLCLFTTICALICVCVYGGQVYSRQVEQKRYAAGFFLAISAFVIFACAVPLFLATVFIRVPVRSRRAAIPPQPISYVVAAPPAQIVQMPASPPPVLPPPPPASAPAAPAPTPRVVIVRREPSYTSSSSSSSSSSSFTSYSSSTSTSENSSESTEVITVYTGAPAPPTTTTPVVPHLSLPPAVYHASNPPLQYIGTSRLVSAHQQHHPTTTTTSFSSPTYLDATVREPSPIPAMNRSAVNRSPSPRIIGGHEVVEKEYVTYTTTDNHAQPRGVRHVHEEPYVYAQPQRRAPQSGGLPDVSHRSTPR